MRENSECCQSVVSPKNHPSSLTRTVLASVILLLSITVIFPTKPQHASTNITPQNTATHLKIYSPYTFRIILSIYSHSIFTLAHVIHERFYFEYTHRQSNVFGAFVSHVAHLSRLTYTKLEQKIAASVCLFIHDVTCVKKQIKNREQEQKTEKTDDCTQRHCFYWVEVHRHTHT